MIFRAALLITALVCLGCEFRNVPIGPPPVRPAAATGPFQFVDVAAQAGLDSRLGHGRRSPLTILDTATGGAALLDYDGDGLLDILIVGERRLWLFRNRDGSRFENVSDAAGLATLTPPPGDIPGASPVWMGVASGDIDNDGFLDIYVTGYRCSLLLHNRAGKRFEDITKAAGVHNRSHWETSAAFFDADGDRREDLYVARYVRFGPQEKQFCSFRGVEASCPPHYYDAEPGIFFKNIGRLRFKDHTRAAGLDVAHGKGLGVAVADVNGDGKPDLYVANDGVPANHYRNLGGSRFREVGLESGTAYTAQGQPHAGMGVDWGDSDNSGHPDLVVTAFQHEGCTLYRNEGMDRFVEVSAEAGLQAPTLRRLGFGTKFGDFDNDGRLDLILANGHVQDTIRRFDETAEYAQPAQIFHNRGRGTFQDVSAAAGAPFQRSLVGRALCVGDVDNDGRLDVLIVDAEGTPLLLHNQTPRNHHWLGLRLIGTRSPRSGTGAIVTVRTRAGTQRREAGTSGSYLSASDGRVHFGLGANQEVQQVTIRWPSGRTERLTDLPTDRWLGVREGEGVVQSDGRVPR